MKENTSAQLLAPAMLKGQAPRGLPLLPPGVTGPKDAAAAAAAGVVVTA
jgi:hypothetical protein